MAFPENWLTLLGTTLGLVLVAGIGNWAATRLFRGTARRIASRTTSTWDDRIIERRVLARLAHLVPAAILYFGIGPALGITPAEIAAATEPDLLILLTTLVRRVAAAFVILTAAMAFSGFLEAVNDIYQESYAEAKSRPIKGYLQVISLVAWLGALVIMVSILADRNPTVFLSGLGALTAVLLLVFRDTILSLVASVQIMSNDMIRLGDWVEMPQANADGDVIDIALHTVKIQNWDKTISAIPTHKFIGESFKNWRGMSESGGRRIKRSLHIDMNSVGFLNDEQIERLAQRELLREYMTGKRADLARHEEEKAGMPEDVIPEMRRLTNLGTFRAYVLEYLRANPAIHRDMTLLVRQMEPGPKGVPIQIYCFTNDTAWANYERIQGDIFDHLMAILPEFGLLPFQEPSGRDFGRLGSLHQNA